MLNSFGNKDQTTIGNGISFIFDPELRFSAQIMRIIRKAAEEGQNFIIIMGVSFYAALSLNFAVRTTDPNRFCVTGSGNHFADALKDSTGK